MRETKHAASLGTREPATQQAQQDCSSAAKAGRSAAAPTGW